MRQETKETAVFIRSLRPLVNTFNASAGARETLIDGRQQSPAAKIAKTTQRIAILPPVRVTRRITRARACALAYACGIKKYRSADLQSCHSSRTATAGGIGAILICIFYECGNKSVGRRARGKIFPSRRDETEGRGKRETRQGEGRRRNFPATFPRVGLDSERGRNNRSDPMIIISFAITLEKGIPSPTPPWRVSL